MENEEVIPIKPAGVINYTNPVVKLSIPELRHTQSTYGPTEHKKRVTFYITVLTMVFCAANNDFLGKLTYQSLPKGEFLEMLWIAWLLSFGTFAICSLGILIGWSGGRELQKLKNADHKIYGSFFIAGCCHVWMNGCRYTGLLFLPAPVVTILKSGSQLLFSSLFRYVFEHKQLNKTQKVGILLTCLGLCFVIVPVYINGSESSIISHVIGILLLLSVGLVGALRNQYEQNFVRMKFKSMFVVGVRSFASLIVTGILGIILYVVPQIPNTLAIISYYPYFILFFCLFLMAIFLKNYSQMKVIKMSSAVTRNLFMQGVPSITWILSLLLHYIVLKVTEDSGYGEQWHGLWDLFRVGGFIIVWCGACIYIRYKSSKSKSRITPLSMEAETVPITSVE
eukprot:163105_1